MSTTREYSEVPHHKPTDTMWVVYPDGSYSDIARMIPSIRPRLADFTFNSPKKVTSLVVTLASFTGDVADLESLKEVFGACELIKTRQPNMWQLVWSPTSRLSQTKKYQ